MQNSVTIVGCQTRTTRAVMGDTQSKWTNLG